MIKLHILVASSEVAAVNSWKNPRIGIDMRSQTRVIAEPASRYNLEGEDAKSCREIMMQESHIKRFQVGEVHW